MDDDKIVELFWQRAESAIRETEKKYTRYIKYIAYRILGNHEDAEECENDVYLKTWNSIPPNRPNVLPAFLAKITRNLALDKYDKFPDALENMIWAPHGSTSEIVDGFTEWNGLTVKMSLKNALEDTDNAGKYFAVVISKKDRSDMDNKQSSVRYLGELQEKNKNICIRMYNGYAVLFVTADELSGVKLSNLSECVFALYSRVATIGGLLPDGGDIPDNCA